MEILGLNYDYSKWLMFDSPQNLPFLEPWTVIQFTDIEGCSLLYKWLQKKLQIIPTNTITITTQINNQM